MKQSTFLFQIHRLFFSQRTNENSDAELLTRFTTLQDDEAFTTLVQRHGPMVWRVTRRMLPDEHLAEDVFQAVFFVLARKASSIRRPNALVGWLHGVATRLALKTRLQHQKRKGVATLDIEPAAPDPVDEMTVRELRAVLDEELLHLPDKYRYPLVLCYLEGKTRDEAANQLNCPPETLKSRLERGRELLQKRLAKRRLAFSTALLSLLVAEGSSRAAPQAALLAGTAQAAAQFSIGMAVTGGVPQRATALAQSTLRSMRLAPVKSAAACLALLSFLTLAAVIVSRSLDFHSGRTPAGQLTDVFEGPPAPLDPRLRADLPRADGPLRRLIVEERVGVARQGELVRVPVFFHEGECRDPHALEIHQGAGAQPIAYQPDDIRRADDGSVSRMHLYFEVDLQPWQRREFVLTSGENPGKTLPPLGQKIDGGRVTLGGDDLRLSFWMEGPRAGAIAAIQSSLGKVTLPDDFLAPCLLLRRQSPDLAVTRETLVSYQQPETLEVRDLRFGSGPLFAKLIVRIGPPGKADNAEFTYLLPRSGHQFIQTERLFADDPASPDAVGAAVNTLLEGRLVLGDSASDQRVAQYPAGIRRLTRSTQGLNATAIVNAKAGLSLIPISCVPTELKGIDLGNDGRVSVRGSENFRRTELANSTNLHAFWGQTRLVFARATTPEALWEATRAHAQPLTAVVEEPGVSADDLHLRLAELMKQFPVSHTRSWMQEVGRLYTLGDTAGLKKLLTGTGQDAEETPEHWFNAATNARATITRNGTIPLNEGDKGRASSLLDPWALTYSASPTFALAALGEPTARLDRICLAIGKAQRQFNGRVDAQGFPYIDCFNQAFNMQGGSIAAGIYGARKTNDLDLVQFYRDCARRGRELDLGPHGFREYPSLPESLGQSDLPYQNTCDFYLRVAELMNNEDFWIHPIAFGRYADCVDVNADLCHRASNGETTGWHRANFFRGQSHDHGWDTWSVGPFLALLGKASDQGSVGLTDACFFARHMSGMPMNWTEITTFFHADLAMREGLRRYQPEVAPALPSGVEVIRQPAQNRVRWQPLDDADIQGYRVYRADQMGGPWTLLNSPYTQTPGPLVRGGEFTDAEGKANQVYFVTAVDSKRHESRWFPAEPRPTAGNAPRE